MTDYRCTQEGTLSELKTNVRAIFQRFDEMRNIYENLTKLTDSVHNLTVTMSVFAEQMKDTKEDMAKIKNDLEYMKNVPLEDYGHIKRTILSAIIGTLVGVLSTLIFSGVI